MNETPRKTTVTLEDLLRVKRAEQPPAEFWTDFERGMRAKQLAAKRNHLEAARDAKRARVDVHEGYDEGKSYIRRYDTKSEFLIKNGSFPQCRRAYLSACPPG